MAFFEWNASYDIGVEEMNSQHQILIEIMNRLHDLDANGSSRSDLGKCLEELGDYTAKHFRLEEAYLDSIEYDGLESHKLIHKDLLETFATHVDSFRTTGQLTSKFFTFLKLWLAAHIRGIDRKYGEFVNS